jgi:hypothetical protein
MLTGIKNGTHKNGLVFDLVVNPEGKTLRLHAIKVPVPRMNVGEELKRINVGKEGIEKVSANSSLDIFVKLKTNFQVGAEGRMASFTRPIPCGVHSWRRSNPGRVFRAVPILSDGIPRRRDASVVECSLRPRVHSRAFP